MNDLKKWVNPAAYLAYVFLTVGVLSQIHTTYVLKSVHDISIVEISGRFVAQLLIMFKMLLVKDRTLVVGHAILTIVYSFYFILVISYMF